MVGAHVAAASATWRVVYLKHTIPPSLPRYSPLSPLLRSQTTGWQRWRPKRKRDDDKSGETTRGEGGVFEGQGGEKVDDDPRQPTPTDSHPFLL